MKEQSHLYVQLTLMDFSSLKLFCSSLVSHDLVVSSWTHNSLWCDAPQLSHTTPEEPSLSVHFELVIF